MCRDFYVLRNVQTASRGPRSPLFSVYGGYFTGGGGVKRLGHDAQLHSSSEDVKNELSHNSTPVIRLRGVDRENFAFTSAL